MRFSTFIFLSALSLSIIWNKEDLKIAFIDNNTFNRIEVGDICEDVTKFMTENPDVLDRNPSQIIPNYQNKLERKKERLIGKGGFGIVFEVKFNGLPAAVKIVKKGVDEESVGNELFYWIKLYVLKENTVPAFFDCVTDKKYVYFFMELMDGSIGDLIPEFRSTWSETQKLSLFLSIEKVMENMEELQITHHDIKPGNIFYKKNAGNIEIRLGDFGMASQKMRHIVPGGTDGFFAPEVYESGKSNFKVDAFATGMTFWNMFSDDIFIDTEIKNINKSFPLLRTKLRDFFVKTMNYNVNLDSNIKIMEAANIAEVITVMTRAESYRRPIASAVVKTLERLISEQTSKLI